MSWTQTISKERVKYEDGYGFILPAFQKLRSATETDMIKNYQHSRL
jgi:hypothetical protein